MNDLTDTFGTLYFPIKAFVLYRNNANDYQSKCYVESYDFDANGTPVNAHPLSDKESLTFAKALTVKTKKEGGFLRAKGLLPANLLYVNTGINACAIWRSPPQNVNLLFDEELSIKSGKANIPPLIWKATKGNLQVFAIKEKQPDEQTPLFHAPFFNLSSDGRVCMGNVQVKIPKDCPLEDFIFLWQEYFFNSYFTHLLDGVNPVAGNIIQLWQGLIGNAAKFPMNRLIPNRLQLNNLIP